jgi:3-hydroxybutyryl-CoA dehydrogenase
MAESLEDYSLRKKDYIKPGNGGLKKVGVIGCGNMGQEIVRIISQHGIDVVFLDVNEERINVILEEISASLDEIINKWGLTTSEKRAILSRIRGSTNYKDISDCKLVIESINIRQRFTSLEARKEVFKNIEAVVSHSTVIASNNSTLMISDLASVIKYPERVVGVNFINPSSSVKVVEVVRGLKTSDAAYDFVIRFIKMLDKIPVELHESPGNISTRLIVTLINEACELLMEGVASVRYIDMTMKSGYGLQFGPFELADRVGLDKVLKWMNNLYMEFGTPCFKPSPIIKRLVRANYLGKKTGKGFYKYEDGMIISQAITATEFI